MMFKISETDSMGLSLRNCEVSSVGKIFAEHMIFSSAALNGDEAKILVKGLLCGGVIKVVLVLTKTLP